MTPNTLQAKECYDFLVLYFYLFFKHVVRVLMFQNRVNPACHVYFMGIHFYYTEFNEEFENLCLKNFPTFRHRQFFDVIKIRHLKGFKNMYIRFILKNQFLIKDTVTLHNIYSI